MQQRRVTKMKKKAPKSSRKSKNAKEHIIIALAFLAFLAALGVLFYYNGFPNLTTDIAATVNGKAITAEELDWWYRTSVLPEYRDIVSKKSFLESSLIPQEVLLQEAEKRNIQATEDEIDKALGIYIIENGLTLEEFEKHLNSREITIDEIRGSFRTRAIITKLLGEEGISYDGGINEKSFQEFIEELMNNSKVITFDDTMDKMVLKGFQATGDASCNYGKPMVMLFTTSKCKLCNETAAIFEKEVMEFAGKGLINAAHWRLDEGDNILTLEKETGVPKQSLQLFKKYSPDMLVPATIAACEYKKIGALANEDAYELKLILKKMVGD